MPSVTDPRHIANGREIPTESYCDQPYIVTTDDDAWLCVLTTGAGREGDVGQHVITVRSTDRGHTWSSPVALEPPRGPEASYAVLLKAPSGRVFCFYNYNAENLRAVKADNPPYPDGLCMRVDSLGSFVFKYSDDHGQTWSQQRYRVPVREMAIDRENAYGGDLQFFWNVGRPFVHDGAAYVSLHKVGGFGYGFFTRSEGVLLKSSELLTASDPATIDWETLPDGDAGLRTPAGGGPIAEEHSYSVLSDGSFFCVYRSVDGHPVCTYSRDGGHTWSAPEYQRFADGRVMKNPRAANFAWRCANGHYLYWFHNHGGSFIQDPHGLVPYMDRNPVWLCGGVEADSSAGKVIQWSQPDIVLYDDDPFTRMSYPDLVEADGRYFVTETQKDIARVHELDRQLLDGLWNQDTRAAVAAEGLLLALPEAGSAMPVEVEAPRLPMFCRRDPNRADGGGEDLRQGFSIDIWARFATLDGGQRLIDTRNQAGQGICLQTIGHAAVELILNDGRTEQRWACDPGVLALDVPQHLVVIVDGGPKIISFVVNGQLCDGGDDRQFGWGRFSPHLMDVNGSATHLALTDVPYSWMLGGTTTKGENATNRHTEPQHPSIPEQIPARQRPRLQDISSDAAGSATLRIGSDSINVTELRVYGRALRVSEALSTFRAR